MSEFQMRERVDKWWTESYPGPVSSFMALWIIMMITASLLQAVVSSDVQAPEPVYPTWTLLVPIVIIGISILLIVSLNPQGPE